MWLHAQSIGDHHIQNRQNYHDKSEAAVNHYINLALHASNVYFIMGYVFNCDVKCLPRFSSFLLRLSDEAREQAEKLMELQNLRGGRIQLTELQQPQIGRHIKSWEIMEAALILATYTNDALLDLCRTATVCADGHLRDFIGRNLLYQQAQTVRELEVLVYTLMKLEVCEVNCAEFLLTNFSLRDDTKS